MDFAVNDLHDSIMQTLDIRIGIFQDVDQLCLFLKEVGRKERIFTTNQGASIFNDTVNGMGESLVDLLPQSTKGFLLGKEWIDFPTETQILFDSAAIQNSVDLLCKQILED
jgi:hypothetical protein